jgi:hypothetical protein
MKNTILFLFAALLLTATTQAQSTADSIAAKYKLLPMPEPLTIEKTFPVLGSYQISTEDATAEATTITVSLDPENKGIIWIEGLKEGKIKAYMKKRPSIYRIVPQKSESGKQIPEGTLVYDQAAGTLQVVIGKPYNESDPVAVFAGTSESSSKAKSKTKAKFYTASKIVAEPALQAEGTSSTPQ